MLYQFARYNSAMAGYKGHVAGGAVLCMLYVAVLNLLPIAVIQSTASGILSNWQMTAGLFVIAMLFGLWPDIDTNSKGQDLFFGIAFITNCILVATGRFEAAAYLGLLAMTPIIGKHRGWTHSKLAMLLIPSPIILIPYLHNRYIWDTGLVIYGAAVTGYFSHLLLDGRITKYIRFKT